MRHRSLFWQVFPTLVGFSVATVAVVLFFVGYDFNKSIMEHTQIDLDTTNRLIALNLGQDLAAGNIDQIRKKLKRLGIDSRLRISIAGADGQILVDSHWVKPEFKQISERPEIHLAGENQSGIAKRYSFSQQAEYLFVAQKIDRSGKLAGYVRTGFPTAHLRSLINRSIRSLIGAGILFVVFVAAAVWLIAQKVAVPLDTIRTQTDQIAKGDFSSRLEFAPSQAREIADLARSVNEVAVQLNTRIKTILEQKTEQDAVFSSMAEGVIAVDAQSHIKHINEPAAKILGIPHDRLQALKQATVEEVVRTARLQDVIKRSLKAKMATEDELDLYLGGEERILQIHASPLRNFKGKRTGSVLVFSDITRMKQLENMRREFVANVSHELRTPLTTIQGFVETLQSSNVSEKDRDDFLRIISQHAQRLGKIIEDLLSLSRIEKDSDQNQIELNEQNLRPIVKSAVDLCRPRARKKNIEIELDCPNDLRARVNSTLIEQALVNLLDNAIKYSENDKSIFVRVHPPASGSGDAGSERAASGEAPLNAVQIEVADQGFGIAEEHLPRLFERFYRVDKARSRNMGGTGLGLSIVKHIAIAHGGNVQVQSHVGEGSTFRINLGS